MRFGKCYVARMHRLRVVAFNMYRDEVLSIAIASSSFVLLATSLILVADAAIPAAVLTACAAVSLLVHFLSQNIRLCRAVRAGLRRGEFHVVYQPIIDTRTQCCVGVEALLRWCNAKFAAGGPGVFMAKLEGTRWVGVLTRFVLLEANRALAPATFARHWHLSVNICARHLMEKGFVEDICESAGPVLGRLVSGAHRAQLRRPYATCPGGAWQVKRAQRAAIAR
ncbi:EAL domain-containing protein [Paraburkholderia terrae]